MMKNIIAIMVLLAVLTGCKSSEHSHKPGRPYYFKSGVTYQGHRPTGEITKSEADKLADSGYAYYIAHFSPDGNPVKIFKVYQGATNLYCQPEKE